MRKNIRIESGLGCLVLLLAIVLMSGQSRHVAQAQGGTSGTADERAGAIALERAGRNAEAIAAWVEIAKAEPKSAEPLAHIGLLYAREQNYGAAIESYLSARRLDAGMPGLGFNLGLAYFKNGSFAEAIREFEPLMAGARATTNAAAQSDQLARLNLLLGMSHYGLREFKQAAEYLREASAKDGGNAALLLTLARSCLMSRQYACVDESYHRLLALNAESAEADLLAGEAYDDMGDTPSAVRMFKQAVAANARFPGAEFGLGYLLWKQKEYEQAASELEKAVAQEKDDLNARLYLADCRMHLGQNEVAAKELRAIAVIAPGSALLHEDLATIAAAGGDAKGAIAEFEKAKELEPENATIAVRLGRLYATSGDKERANAEFARAKQLGKEQNESLVKMMEKARSNEK